MTTLLQHSFFENYHELLKSSEKSPYWNNYYQLEKEINLDQNLKQKTYQSVKKLRKSKMILKKVLSFFSKFKIIFGQSIAYQSYGNYKNFQQFIINLISYYQFKGIFNDKICFENSKNKITFDCKTNTVFFNDEMIYQYLDEGEYGILKMKDSYLISHFDSILVNYHYQNGLILYRTLNIPSASSSILYLTSKYNLAFFHPILNYPEIQGFHGKGCYMNRYSQELSLYTTDVDVDIFKNNWVVLKYIGKVVITNFQNKITLTLDNGITLENQFGETSKINNIADFDYFLVKNQCYLSSGYLNTLIGSLFYTIKSNHYSAFYDLDDNLCQRYFKQLTTNTKVHLIKKHYYDIRLETVSECLGKNNQITFLRNDNIDLQLNIDKNGKHQVKIASEDNKNLKGELLVYKSIFRKNAKQQTEPLLVVMSLPKDALIDTNGSEEKMRTNKVKVEGIYQVNGPKCNFCSYLGYYHTTNNLHICSSCHFTRKYLKIDGHLKLSEMTPVSAGYSQADPNFIYHVGKNLRIPNFKRQLTSCGIGIHFYLDPLDAINHFNSSFFVEKKITTTSYQNNCPNKELAPLIEKEIIKTDKSIQTEIINTEQGTQTETETEKQFRINPLIEERKESTDSINDYDSVCSSSKLLLKEENIQPKKSFWEYLGLRRRKVSPKTEDL